MYDLIVLGGGPGGYAAALRARALGLTVALVEREGVGGTCLHHGCIPSKSLLRGADLLEWVRRAGLFGIHVEQIRADFGQAVARSQQVVSKLHDGLLRLIKKGGVDIYTGHGRLEAADRIAVLLVSGETIYLSGRRVVIATGSRVRGLPASIASPSLALAPDGVHLYTSDEALLRRDLPASVVILGGGATGCEFAYLYAVYGVRVHLVECAASLLPSEDREVSAALARSFRRRGIEVLTGTRIHAIRKENGSLRIESTRGSLSAEALLLAIGRAPNVEEIGCDAVGVALQNGAIKVDERMRTGVADIFAVGDVTTRPALAHGAMAQGVAVAEWIAGIQRPPVSVIPNAIYCQPQVASVGLTEEGARAANLPMRVGRFPFSANGKAVSAGETEGFVKVIIHATDDRILGAHIVGSEATELIGEFSLAIGAGIGMEAFSRAVRPHPTLSEAIGEALGMARGTAIHI